MSVYRTVYEIFSVNKWRECVTLKLGVGVVQGLEKVAPFDRSYATFYLSAIEVYLFHTCFIPVGPTVRSWLRTQRTNPEIGPSLSNVLYQDAV